MIKQDERVAHSPQSVLQQIAAQPGGAKGFLLSAEVLAAADNRLKQMTPVAFGEIRDQIAAIEDIVRNAGSSRELFDRAHNIRGIAGTFGLDDVGLICNALCRYGSNLPKAFQPDWELIQSLIKMLARTFAYPNELSLDAIADYCRRAVSKTMMREGRLMGAEGG